MQVSESKVEKDVIDYDFALTNGIQLKQTLDYNAGDSAEELSDRWLLHLAQKPSLIDPEVILPAERVNVYKTQIIALVIRERKQKLPTTEDKFAMLKLLHKVPDTLQ